MCILEHNELVLHLEFVSMYALCDCAKSVRNRKKSCHCGPSTVNILKKDGFYFEDLLAFRILSILEVG
jgi:hypothetical protein